MIKKELSQEQLSELKEKFINIARENIKADGIEALISYLENSDFFTAPASTQYHYSYAGGLVEHSIDVYERLLKEVSYEHNNNLETINNETLAIVGLFHDVCKVDTYEKDFRNYKKYDEFGTKFDEKGKYDWAVESYYKYNDKLPFGHGAKSVYIIQNFFSLSRDEALAIRHHTGGVEYAGVPILDSTASEAFKICPLALLLHIADQKSSYLSK